MAKKVNPEVWFEIFGGGKQVGTQTGPQGDQIVEVDGDELIDKAIASFAAKGVNANIVIGHPKRSDYPAFGKIVELKTQFRDGKKWLLGKAVNVHEDFAEQKRQGFWPYRSCSFDADGGLNHLGMLPSNKPGAVKGMIDFVFQERQAGTNTISFVQEVEFGKVGLREYRNLLVRLRDFIFGAHGQEAADKVVPQYELDWTLERQVVSEMEEKDAAVNSGFQQTENQQENNDMAGDKQFSAADIEAAKKEAAAAAETKIKAEFAAAQAEEAKKKASIDFAAVTTQRIKDGVWAPAIKDAGLLKLAEGFGPEKIEFSQADGSTLKKTPHELLISVIDAAVNAPKMHKKEFATAEDEDEPVDTKDAKKGKEVYDKAKAYQFQQKQAGVEIKFRDAVRHVTGGK